MKECRDIIDKSLERADAETKKSSLKIKQNIGKKSKVTSEQSEETIPEQLGDAQPGDRMRKTLPSRKWDFGNKVRS